MPRIEPSASPSGFSWVTSRKRSCSRRRPRHGRGHSSSGASSSINFDIRTPSSTEGSYSNVRVGVRFIRTSRPMRACRTPCAARARRETPRASARSRARSRTPSPGRRSRRVSHAGHRHEADARVLQLEQASGETSRSGSLTFRIRSLINGDDLPLGPYELPLLRGEVALGGVEQLARSSLWLARDARHRQPRSLPEVVVVDLCHRRAEAVLELRLRRLQCLRFPLSEPASGKRSSTERMPT